MNLQNLFRSYCAPLFYHLAQAFVLNDKRRFIILCMPFWLLVVWATWSVHTHFFFWDTVQLGSQQAHFFYETGFSTLLLPDEMDSGHPPIFGFYLALVWLIFGKTLTVSHLAMLPLLLGIVWQAFLLGEKFLGAWQAVFFPLVLCCNPIMASQAVLVSPDVVLVFFFLLSLNFILHYKTIGFEQYDKKHNRVFAFIENKIKNRTILLKQSRYFTFIQNPRFQSVARTHRSFYWLSLAILGLAMISMRGMMLCVVLFLFDLFHNHSSEFMRQTGAQRINSLLQAAKPYIIGFLAAFSFLLFHYIKKGWIGYHANSEWAEAFQVVDFHGFIKNIGILCWRLMDFGHVFIALIILICFSLLSKVFFTEKRYQTFKKTRTLGVLLGISLLVLTPTLLLYKGLLAHRYLLPIYLILNFLCLKLISDLKTGKWQPFLFMLVFTGLVSGNFWVYPQPISTGWDSTLAHLPYYRLRNEMIQYIDNQGIKYSEVGTTFPNLRPFKLVDLKENTEGDNFSPLDLKKNHYIFYSNVMNDFNKKELAILEKEWQVVKKMTYPNPFCESDMIQVILYTHK